MKGQWNLKKKFAVILVRPEGAENIGLVARSMRNTGFEQLRLVGVSRLQPKSFVTAVHARDILENAGFYADLRPALADLDMVFASSAKSRKNFSFCSLREAAEEVRRFPPATTVGLVFGNERTGLTSAELRHSNFRFRIPQARRQPSYNLASAVLLTLFALFDQEPVRMNEIRREKPLSRKAQEEFIRLVLARLEKRRFIHRTNREHVSEMLSDLFGRIALTERERNLLLALFSKV